MRSFLQIVQSDNEQDDEMNALRRVFTDVTADKLPTLAEVSPEYANLQDRRTKLQEEAAAIRTERAEMGKTLNFNFIPGRAADDRGKRVAAMLGDEVPTNARARFERYWALGERLADIEEALQILSGKLYSARMAASAIICNKIAPVHKAKVREVAEKLLAARIAYRDYLAFADELNAGAVAWSQLHPIQPHFLGAPNDRNGHIARWLREARDNDLIPASFVPEGIR